MYGIVAATTFKVIGVMLGAMALMAIVALVILQLWVRKKVRNNVYAFILDHKHLFTAMLPIEGECIYYGKGESKEKYLLDTNKQFWVDWPPAATKYIGSPVRAHWYVRNQPQPLDPEGKSKGLSSRSLRMIGDEAMLKTTWRDVRDSAGAPAGSTKPGGITFLILIGLVILGIVNLYLSTNLQQILSTISKALGA